MPCLNNPPRLTRCPRRDGDRPHRRRRPTGERVTAAGLALGYGADLALGDPRRGHPVAAFGQLALAAERASYGPSHVRGAAFTGALVLGAALAGEAAAQGARRAGGGRGLALAAVSWAALGGRSLRREATAIAARLDAGDLAGARRALPTLCGRDAQALDAPQIARAVVESVAENTSDAVVGTLLWGALAGPAGVAAYRAANTLDAMVGHRTPRYAQFGWASARLDDALGWLPARAGAGLAVLCAPAAGGSPARAWRTLRRDGAAHPSPNAGRMEAAFAGALDLRLGGPLAYDRVVQLRPQLGDGRPPGPADIRRAARLSSAVGAATLAASMLVRAARPPSRGTVAWPRRVALAARLPAATASQSAARSFR
ncbi:MAG: adenosylcobinamide-phosphate synthase [Solirubrobacteraceae bacterium]|nr:adenosylcobinamide-phosphate synthase [Solirubrobacteraceae bacterium]